MKKWTKKKWIKTKPERRGLPVNPRLQAGSSSLPTALSPPIMEHRVHSLRLSSKYSLLLLNMSICQFKKRLSSRERCIFLGWAFVLLYQENNLLSWSGEASMTTMYFQEISKRLYFDWTFPILLLIYNISESDLENIEQKGFCKKEIWPITLDWNAKVTKCRKSEPWKD
jgi:hypothetical protein